MEQTTLKTVGRFELTRLLNREGAFAVYLGHDPHLDRDLDIRIGDLSGVGPALRQEFEQRLRKFAEFRNGHVATVLDIGQADGLDYFATNHVEGETLTKITEANRGIEPRQVALLVGKLALVMHEMHGAGLIHGALSPDAVVLEKSGEPVIADLGLPAALRKSMHGSAIPHGEFVAPELRQDDPGEPVPASDIYSLGAIGFFVLTGRPPKSAGDTEDPTFLEGLDESTAGKFKTVFSKALAEKPEDRFATARDLAGTMDRLFRVTPRINPASSESKPKTADSGESEYDQFDFQLIEDSHVVHLHDASVLSSEALVRTKRELFEMVEAVDPKRLIVNFGSVRFCSSETIGILIQLKTELKPRDTQLYLCGMRDSIRDVFRVLNLDGKVFEIRGTVTNALRSLE